MLEQGSDFFRAFFFALNNSMKIICYTLFDVTRTGVNFRNRFDTRTDPELAKQRNQQSNFETILQVVGMRSQPEDITDSDKITVTVDELAKYNFGYLFSKKYLKNVKSVTVWSFTFMVDGVAIFDDGISELGNLLQDCAQVPMIIGLEESVKLANHLDITDQARNIQFIKSVEHEEQT